MTLMTRKFEAGTRGRDNGKLDPPITAFGVIFAIEDGHLPWCLEIV